MGRIRHLKGDGDEAVEVHGRTDHCDPAGTGSRIEDGGCLPQSRDQQRDVLQMEGQVWWPGRIGSSAPQGPSDENARLKKLLAEAMLDNAMLKDLNSKKW
jgi:hypothetical protein